MATKRFLTIHGSARTPVKKSFSLPSRTQQSFKNECDINVVIDRFVKTGTPLPAIQYSPADFTNVGDFQEVQNKLLRAQDEFSRLPAKVRDNFKNSPALLLDYLSSNPNENSLIKAGLLQAPPPGAGAGGEKHPSDNTNPIVAAPLTDNNAPTSTEP